RACRLSASYAVRSGGGDRQAVRLLGGPGRDLRDVYAGARLDAVIPTTGNPEDRKPPQQPRDVVDEDVALAEDQGRPDDRVSEAGFADRPPGARLARAGAERRIHPRLGPRGAPALSPR